MSCQNSYNENLITNALSWGTGVSLLGDKIMKMDGRIGDPLVKEVMWHSGTGAQAASGSTDIQYLNGLMSQLLHI